MTNNNDQPQQQQRNVVTRKRKQSLMQDNLALSLNNVFNNEPPPQQIIPIDPNPPLAVGIMAVAQQRQQGTRQVKVRRNSRASNKSDTIPIPHPWATDKRATVHSMEYLLNKGIRMVSNKVKCKKCEREYVIEYDVEEKFKEVANFLLVHQPDMHERAPDRWMNPVLPTCKFCGQENSCKPVISSKKKSIDWLFLLLGQLLGCCTLDQLKYFCKHTKNHRTGAKDRVLYLAYLALSKQLDPNGPFDYHAQ